MPLVDPVTTTNTPRKRRGGKKAPAAAVSAASAAAPARSSDDTASATGDNTPEPADSSAALAKTRTPPSTSAPAPAALATPALALVARNAGPVILLAALAWSFDGLTISPQSSGSARSEGPSSSPEGASTEDKGATTLALLLGVAAVVQVGSTALGLPPAGTDAESLKKRKARKDYRKPNIIVTTVLSLVMTALSVPFIYFLLLMFGAPMLYKLPRTLLCASHLALLGLFPVVYTRGTDSGTWRALISGQLDQLDAAVGGLWGTAVGAWLGAMPIALDWDRSWQAWPVTVVVGLYLGHAVGRLVGGEVAQRR